MSTLPKMGNCGKYLIVFLSELLVNFSTKSPNDWFANRIYMIRHVSGASLATDIEGWGLNVLRKKKKVQQSDKYANHKKREY